MGRDGKNRSRVNRNKVSKGKVSNGKVSRCIIGPSSGVPFRHLRSRAFFVDCSASRHYRQDTRREFSGCGQVTRRFHWFVWLGTLLVVVVGGCFRQPYTVVKVKGTVAYEDGSLIPAEGLVVRFEPLAEPVNDRTHPRAGVAHVNPADGSFGFATTYHYGDGIIFGKHRVLVMATGFTTGELIPGEYSNPRKTPVSVDTSQQPFEIRIRKP